MSTLTVLFPDQGQSVASFERDIEAATGDLLILFAELELDLHQDEQLLNRVCDFLKGIDRRVRIATNRPDIIHAARSRGLRVITSTADLKKLLAGHPQLDDALREFEPHIWRQQLRNQLQSIGLLSLPKLRIWILIAVSAYLFFFVVFKLLPSATITVSPREDTLTQTANIFLAQSGAIAELPPRVKVIELRPMTVRIDKTMTFGEISEEFEGESAQVVMTVLNNADETYWLRANTRLQNQAGMVFRMESGIRVDPDEEVTVLATAEDLDIYDEIIGERGNVPEGLKWFFPGLSPDEQQLVYAENREPGTGGTTQSRKVLSERDLELATITLEDALRSEAKQLVEEERQLYNAEHDNEVLELLYYDELTKVEYVDFSMPREFLGQPVESVPVHGSILFTMYAYDTQQVLNLLSRELKTHVGNDKILLEETLSLERLVTHVIDYTDDFSWIKITVDLSGTTQYILDPLSPTGAVFAKKVRQLVEGIGEDEAQRIVSNLPEVQKADVDIWPPWNGRLPSIPSHIIIETES